MELFIAWMLLKKQELNFLGIGLTGIGFSGIPPLLISSIGKISGQNNAIALAILFIFGALGGSFIPFIIKYLAGFNIFASMAIVIILMAAFLVLVIIRKHYEKSIKNHNPFY